MSPWLPRNWKIRHEEFERDRLPGQAPALAVASFASRTILVSPRETEHLSSEQREQLLLHEIAHARTRCECWKWTGHCIHWRRIAREIGYRDAFTFAPPIEEMDPWLAKETRSREIDHLRAADRGDGPVAREGNSLARDREGEEGVVRHAADDEDDVSPFEIVFALVIAVGVVPFVLLAGAFAGLALAFDKAVEWMSGE